MTAPDRVWVFGELEGWHNTGHGRARDFNRYPLDDRERTTGAEYVRADIVQELAAALEEISEFDGVCRRNCEFRKSLGWYEDETIRVRDQHNAMAWAEAAKIARAALAKLKEAGSANAAR